MHQIFSEKKEIFISPDDRELVEAVINATCQRLEICREDLMKDRRHARHRNICYYIISRNTQLKETAIGKVFGHSRTACRYGIEQVGTHVKIYRQTLDMYTDIMELANTFDKKYQWRIY